MYVWVIMCPLSYMSAFCEGLHFSDPSSVYFSQIAQAYNGTDQVCLLDMWL